MKKMQTGHEVRPAVMNYVSSDDVRFLAHIQLPGFMLVNGSFYPGRVWASTK